jgi:Flp pilus assembly protein CpaB
LPHHTPSRRRPAAVTASTVFAITLAILAGLVFAWVAKVVLLGPKPPAAPPPMAQLTVLAANIMEKQRVDGNYLKTISLPQAQYDDIMTKARQQGLKVLVGNQPVGRIAKEPLNAEEPIYDHQLEPFRLEALSSRVGAGKRAVTLELPLNRCQGGLIRPNDYVDLLCTLNIDNPAVGGATTATATIAKGVKVIARNNTTATADVALGVPAATRPYTLEATPYRAAIIDLAEKMGGTFTMVIANPPATSASQVAASAKDEEPDPDTDVVSGGDLARIFGIPELPPPPPVWTVEHMSGIHRAGYQAFPYGNQKPQRGETTSSAAPPQPATLSRGRAPAGRVNSLVAYAGRNYGGNYGFRPLGSPAPSGNAGGCPPGQGGG